MRGLTHRAVDERAGLPQGSTSNHARTRQALLETAVRRQVQLEARVLAPEELPGARTGPTTDGEVEATTGADAGAEVTTGAGAKATTGADAGAEVTTGADAGAEVTTGAGAEATASADAGASADQADPRLRTAALADVLSLALHRYLTDHRALLVSRYELALEATRRPELRTFFDAAGSAFRDPLVAMTTAAGSPEPERHALSLVAWCEGLMFSCAAGSFHAAVPSRAELRTGFEELLRGMLGSR
ncbi:TetR/AcrR family transcriptional regulator [Streptomyces venezuelae]|uniref:TetR/AcrR family transcriptional regulator n=1 Tax=Streptomyces venezuelae TaxID=54571 RepID=UPI003F4D2849